MSDNFESYL